MCGICGIVDHRGGSAEEFNRRLPAMTDTLRHRGPDASGVWADARAGLGHRRLSIIDLSDGRQPLSNEDGSLWIAYNGEVYNFAELRDELVGKGHTFRTRTDTEVIVHLWEEEGADCVGRLRGMFAFAIWDTRSRTMHLVRDRLGIKPLYYTVRDGRLIFGSEIKAILAHGEVPRAVRPDALSDYLTFLYVPAPKTMFRDIFKLPPGHWLRFNDRGPVLGQYWDLEPSEPLSDNRAGVERRIVDELSDAVRMRLVSDVPLGAFLSGGIDSSAVVAMMHRAEQDPLVTVTMGFDERRYDESAHARRVADRYGTQHHVETIRPDATRIIDTLAWHYDEPFADYSAIPTYYVSQAARRHVTVALSGDGGDENFAGYRRYRFDLAERRWRGMLPGFVRRGIVGPLARLYPKADWLPRPLRAKATLANLAVDEAEAYCRSVGFLSDDDKRAFFTDSFAATLGDYRSAEIIRDHMARGGRRGLNQLLYTDIKTYLVDDILTKVDRASMAVSLEVRVPILDHVFVEMAHRVPPEMKIDGGQGKAVLKSALRPYLDDATLYRAKQGFTPPVSEWMRGPLKEMFADVLLSRDPAYGSMIRKDVIRRAWDAHQSRRRDYTPLLWAMMSLEMWARRFLGSDITLEAPGQDA